MSFQSARQGKSYISFLVCFDTLRTYSNNVCLHSGDQNRKILEELQKKSQAMKQQSVANSNAGVTTSNLANSNIIVPKVLPNVANNKLLPTSPVPNTASTVGSGPALNPAGQPILTDTAAALTNPNGPVVTLNPTLITASGQINQVASGSNGNQRERAALLHAHQNSFCFFITQDSLFGNTILPVIPNF